MAKDIFDKTIFDGYRVESLTESVQDIIPKYNFDGSTKTTVFISHKHDDLDEIKALKNEKNSLETLYQGWMDSDLNINQLLEDNTDEIVAELAEEYKAKQSKKKAKER